jgi:CHAT domain-containing protein/Flp pilus assembly protein TadD
MILSHTILIKLATNLEQCICPRLLIHRSSLLLFVSVNFILWNQFPAKAQSINLKLSYQSYSALNNLNLSPSDEENADQLLQQGLKSYQMSQFEAAIEVWEQSLRLYQASNNKKGEGVALANLGIAHRALGNYLKALNYLEQALVIHQSFNDQPKQISIFINLGNAYESIGESEQAIKNYQQSIKIARSTGDDFGEEVALGSLGIVLINIGEYEQAIQSFQKSLAIAQKIGDREGEGHTFNNLGVVHHILGDFQQAQTYYQNSLEIAKFLNHLPMQTAALAGLGVIYENLEKYEKSIEYHQQSLALARQMKTPREQTKALNNLAHTLFEAGQLAEAEKHLRLAIQLLDSLRSDLSDAYHISMFDTQILTYNLLQQVLIAKNKIEEALEISEHGRSRAFISLLSKQLSSRSKIEIQALPPNIQKIKEVAQSQKITLVEYSIVPEDNFLVHGKLRGIGGELFIWIVQPTGEVKFHRQDLTSLNITLKELVPESRISLGVRSRGEEEMLAFATGDFVKLKDDAPDWEPWQVVGVNEATQQLELTQSSFAEGVTISRPISDVISKVESVRGTNLRLQKLYQILVEPIADLLPANPEERVVFIPHGELFLVPFAALQDANGNYLIEKHTILTAPAIQVLDLTYQQKQQLTNNSDHSKLPALVVGNPKMPAISTLPGQPAQPLAPLPNAEIEAIEIAQLLKTTPLTGTAPTKAIVLEKMQQSQIIHLATHGLLDDTQGLESAIALAPNDNDSGLLTASEILNLKLQAKLVVLSACNTGRGKITGDGVIGLSRALMSAGVPSAIVSLWTVPDAPTASLMAEFYQQLQLTNDKAKALRNAMLTTMKSHPNPRDWAAFILMGQP